MIAVSHDLGNIIIVDFEGGDPECATWAFIPEPARKTDGEVFGAPR